MVICGEEFEKADYDSMLETCVTLIADYNIKKVYIDGANPAFIRSLKDFTGERSDYEEHIAYLKRMKRDYEQQTMVLPVVLLLDSSFWNYNNIIKAGPHGLS